MDYTAAILYTMIGLFHQVGTVEIETPALGSAHLATYRGQENKCAVELFLYGGSIQSTLEIKPSISEETNHFYRGLGLEGLERGEYLPRYFVRGPKSRSHGFIDLKESSDFKFEFYSNDNRLTINRNIICDVKSCTCSAES